MTDTGRTYLAWASIAVLVVLYTVGFVGMHTDSAAWFVSLSPLTLLLSVGFLLLNHKHWTPAFVLLVVGVLVLGFGVEVLGVRTGIVFGEYAYGQTLGWKLLDVPVIIAFNWLLLLLSTSAVMRFLPFHPALLAVLGAVAMTGMDVLIEPVAIALDYWQWQGGAPPLQNFLGWFVVSYLMQALCHKLHFSKSNPVGVAIFVQQTLFFVGLNLSIALS